MTDSTEGRPTVNARSRPNVLLVIAVVLLSAVLAGCGGGDHSNSDAETITVYSASGLADWYGDQFERFTRDTGIKVHLFEAGSGELVSRVNSPAVWDRLGDGQPVPPADLLVTLPPFIQKAAKAGLLQASGADTTGIAPELIGPDASYVPIVKTALCFIANPAASPAPVSWNDLLRPEFKGKLQYSTPGETGDGTAVLILLKHLMGDQGAMDYLARLNRNNAGSATSTASLQPKVSSGALLVANGDLQMNLASIHNDGSKFNVFFPAMPDGSRTTVSLPYFAGVTATSRWPDKARRLLAYLLSDQVQQSVYAEAFGIPVRDSIGGQAGGRPGAMTPNGLLNGVTVWAPDWNSVLVDLERDIDAYQKAIG